MDDIYITLFLHSVAYGSIMLGFTDMIYFNMRAFGGYDMTLATILVITGTSLGTILNIFIGMGILKLVRKFYGSVEGAGYDKLCFYYNRYGVYLLLLTFMKPFNVLALASGAFRSNVVLSMVLIVTGRAWWYAYDAMLYHGI